MASSALVCDAGRLRFSRVSIKGGESLRRWIGVGEFLGITFVIGACPCDFSITADGPCRTTHFPAVQLRELMRSDGELALELAAILARRILELTDVIVEEAGEPLDLRLYYTLVRLCEVNEGIRRADGYELRISQSDLASMVGSSRQYVNPLLRRMQDCGLIRLGYRSVVLLHGHETRAGMLHGDYP
jgi:CRP-like cAMP-binding protein